MENKTKIETIKSLKDRRALCRSRICDFNLEIENINEMLNLLEPDNKKEERDLATVRG